MVSANTMESAECRLAQHRKGHKKTVKRIAVLALAIFVMFGYNI